MLANLRKRTRLIMFIVAVGFIGGFLLGGTLCEVVSRRTTAGRTRAQTLLEQGVIGVVGDHKVTLDEYRSAMAYVTDKYKTENQLRDLSSEDYTNIENQAWDFVVSELTWAKILRQAREKTTEQEILEIMRANPPEELRKNPELLDDSGRFDAEKYLQVMNNPQNQVYFAKYFQDLAEMLPKEKFRIDVVNSYRVTSLEADQALRAANSNWTITSLYFGPGLAVEKAEPSEAEAQAYYKAHLDEFKTKELRQVQYVSFPLEITGSDSADAEEQIRSVYQQLEGGESFNLTMLDFSNLVADTTSRYIGRDRLDAKTDSVIEALRPGRYSEPFLTDYGWQVVMLDSVSADSVAMRRILIRLQFGAETAGEVRDKVREFSDQATLDGFDTVAQRMGLTVMRARPMVDRKPNLAGLDLTSPSQFVDWALSAKQGDITQEPLRGTSGYYVFQLSEVKPAGVRPFEEAKEAARARLRQEQEREAWLAKADEALAELRAGKTLEQVARENPGIEMATDQFKGILDARRRKGAEFAGAVMGLEQGQVSGVIKAAWGAFILRCDTVEETSGLARGQYYQQRTQQVGQELIQDFLERPKVEDFRDVFSY